MKKSITNKKLIDGILKECLFLDIQGGVEQNGQREDFKIKKIHEKNNFNFNEEKSFSITTSLDCSVGEPYTFTIPLGISSIIFTAKVLESTPEAKHFSYPLEMKSIEQRKQKRFRIIKGKNKFSEILLIKKQSSHEALLSIKDYANLSLGGLLRTNSELPPEQGDILQGVCKINGSFIAINHQVTRINSSNEDLSYHVGLTPLKNTEEPTTSKRLVKRAKHRILTEETLEIASPLNLERKIKLQVQDISVVGFSSKPIKKTEERSLIVGLPYLIRDFNLTAELYEIEGNICRFKITKGSKEDRLQWLKNFDHKIHDTEGDHEVADEIIKLFCDSGAISSNHVLRNRHNREDFQQNFSQTHENKPWIHRWISKDETGNPNGHIGSIRYSDSSWVIGDIVGSPDTTNKMPKTLRDEYLKAFSDWSLSSTPTPTHLIMWLDNHPFWKNYTRLLEDEVVKDEIITSCRLLFTRLSPLSFQNTEKPLSLSEIKANDHRVIIKHLSQLDKIGLRELAESFDFSVFNFGSPYLRQTFTSRSEHFRRKYFYVNHNGYEGIAIITLFPEGSTMNRVPDSIWLFQLTRGDKEEDWKKIALTLQYEGLKMGVSAPSIRRVTTDKNFSKLLPGEKLSLNCYLLSPSFWQKCLEVM